MACIPILCLCYGNVAASWRCFIIRAILSEGETTVLASLALWLPVFLHQFHNSSSDAILVEALGIFKNYNDSVLLSNIGASLRKLFCSVSRQTKIQPKNGMTTEALDFLHCRVCDRTEDRLNHVIISKSQVDPTLVQRFFYLKEHPDKDVVLKFLNCLPAVSCHCVTKPKIIYSLMSLLFHEDEEICDALVLNLSTALDLERNTETITKANRPIAGTVLSFLKESVSLQAENNRNKQKNQRYIVRVLSLLTKTEDECLESDLIQLFMTYIIHGDKEISSLSSFYVVEWCDRLHVNPKEIYLRNGKSLAQVFARVVKEGEIGVALSQIADVFCWDYQREQRGGWVSFGITQLCYLLPPLVLRSCNEMKIMLLQELAGCLRLRLRDMLIDHFQHILAHLVFNCNEEEKLKVLSCISSTTGIGIENIRKCSVQNQVNELVFGLHTHKDAVLKEFLQIKEIESDVRESYDSKELGTVHKQKLIGDFLAPRLLGILGFLDGKLLLSPAMHSEKEAALLSLSELLEVIGKEHVSPVARKVLASLKTALKIRNGDHLTDINCKAWSSFLRRLDEPTLESVLEEVVVLCLPLLKVKPEKLAPVFKSVLVDNEIVKPLLPHLPLLPPHQCLSPINEAIYQAQNQWERTSKECVAKNFEAIWKSLNHESQDVRLHSLKRLKTLLLKDQSLVYQLTLDSEKTHKTVSDIFYTLLGQCRENADLGLLVAECLGLFGAIDPARLHADGEKKSKQSEIYDSIESEAFLTDLIMELSRAFLSATDANTQTCASYAMQEILKAYKIGPSTSRTCTSIGELVYKKFPPNVQEILKPLQNSKYTVASASQRTTTLPSPIYRSKYSKSFRVWVTNWTCSLIDLLSCDSSKQIYTACKPLVRRDSSTALHILPPLIVFVLSENMVNHTPVSSEILSVIGAEIPEDSESKFQPSAELQYLAVQTVFSCLDYVKRWSQKKKQHETTFKKQKAIFNPSLPLQYVSSPPSVHRMESSPQGKFTAWKDHRKESLSQEKKLLSYCVVLDFLDQIPSDALASASFRSQSYSRALLHCESHIKKHKDQLKANLSFLQSIYVALDEPDGVDGVAAIRLEEPTLKEQIIQYEATGRLHDTLGCYERLCIAEETQESYEGMLKCYLSLGQPQSVLNITQGLISRNNELGSRLHEYQVEAAWKLGQWEELANLISAPQTQARGITWGVGVGKALLSAREQNAESYQKAMQELRIQQITPLSAASMEMGRGVYQRAYPHILRWQENPLHATTVSV